MADRVSLRESGSTDGLDEYVLWTKGHIREDSPKTVGSSARRGFLVSGLSHPHSPVSTAKSNTTLTWRGQTHVIETIIDSGADDNFDRHSAHSVAFPLSRLEHPLTTYGLDGHRMEPITHRTEPITLTISGNHVEVSRLNVHIHLMPPSLWEDPGWNSTFPTSAGTQVASSAGALPVTPAVSTLLLSPP